MSISLDSEKMKPHFKTMSYPVQNIVIDRPVKPDDSGIVKPERITFAFNDKVDFPFIFGVGGDFIPAQILNDFSPKGRYKIINESFINDSDFFRQVVNIGKFGWYFIGLPKGRVFDKLIIAPTEMDIDLFISGEDGCLLYSFYNSESDKISVTGKVIKDTGSIYSKLKANADDLELRQFYLNRAIVKARSIEPYREPTPDLLNMDEAAEYLGISIKTLYNWVSDKRISFTKVGSKNKFRKSDLDQYLENQTHKPKTGRRRRER